MLHSFAVCSYIIVIVGILFMVGGMVREHYRDRFTGGWYNYETHLHTLVNLYRDHRYEKDVLKQCADDLRLVREFIETYDGPVDLDNIRRSNISQYNRFIRDMKAKANARWHFEESCIANAIEVALTCYNDDSHTQPLTLRQFVDRTLDMYEHVFLNYLQAEHP